METSQPPRRSQVAEAMHSALVERARARSPEERILLALQLGERCRRLALARTTLRAR